MADHKSIFVPDASVLLKWIVDESDSREQAAFLLKDFRKNSIEMIVPGHCFPEVANMLGRERQDICCSFLSYLMTTEITECPLTVELAFLAFDLMKKYKGISFYDASYHALAIKEGGIFITADEKYYRMTQKEKHILLLKDYPHNT